MPGPLLNGACGRRACSPAEGVEGLRPATLLKDAGGMTLNGISSVNLIFDYGNFLKEQTSEGQLELTCDQIAAKLVPPDRSPGFFGRAWNVLSGDLSRYYSPAREKRLRETAKSLIKQGPGA